MLIEGIKSLINSIHGPIIAILFVTSLFFFGAWLGILFDSKMNDLYPADRMLYIKRALFMASIVNLLILVIFLKR